MDYWLSFRTQFVRPGFDPLHGMPLKNSAMTYTFFNQKFDNGVNGGLSWSGINLMVSCQDITQNKFCTLAKISHPVELEVC